MTRKRHFILPMKKEILAPRIHIKSPKAAPGSGWEFSHIEYGSYDPLPRLSNEARPRARRTKTLPKRVWDGFCNIVMDGADAAVDTASACKKAYSDFRRSGVSGFSSLKSDEARVLVPEASYIASKVSKGRELFASFAFPQRSLKILGGVAVLTAAGCAGVPHLADADWSTIQPVTDSFFSDFPRKMVHLGFYSLGLLPLMAMHMKRQRELPALARERRLPSAATRW